GWDRKKEFNTSGGFRGNNAFYTMLVKEFHEQAMRMHQYGRRNINWSTVAPTGTVSLMTQTTSGLEPLFLPFYFRRKKVNANEPGVKVDFVDQSGDSWQEYPVLHPKFRDWLETTPDFQEQFEAGVISKVEDFNKLTLASLFEDSPWFGSCANDISWEKRIAIQSII